jgi:soluble lytic murein transglycosylase-like protein
MSAPSAIAAIMTRIAEVSQPPAVVAALTSRFAPQLSAALADPSTPAATAPTTGFTGPTTVTGGLQTARIERPGTRPSGSVVALGSSLPAATGTWVSRIPNARGVALAPTIQAAATKYNLDPAFLAAVFWTESSYTPNVVSPTGAIGLGQLMPETAEWLQVDPWDPTQNIEGSAKFYRYLLDKNNGNLDLAIASYAAGPGAVQRAGGIPDQFTANYITKLVGRRDYLNGARSTPP